jgi:predicted permease
MQRTEFAGDFMQDVRFALRTLGRQKTWTAITVITLALGIGATTAVFSVVSTLLLHAIPYPNADRVVYVSQQPSSGNNTGISVTIAPAAAVIRAWRDASHSFEDLEAASIGPRTLKTTSGEPSTVMTAAVLPSFPTFAGERPILGRMFTLNDIEAGGAVAVLGESFWRERLGSDASVLGKAITVGDSTYMIVGVMPAALRFGSAGRRPTDVWMPLDLRNKKLGGNVIGRLRPGVTISAARVELDSIFARSAGFTGGRAPFTTAISTPGERVQFRDSLLLLTGAVGLVLLVACANVAHLLLARTATRRRELAIRAALGAGRGRILRQLLTESFLLSIAGMAGGVFVGWAGLRALVAMRPSSHDELRAAHLDATTLLLAIGVSLVSGVVFGVIGAPQSSRHSTHDSLKSGALSASAGRRHARVRSLLVVSEMALSAMLIVGAALVVRSLQRMQATDLGFDPVRLYTLYPTFGPRIKTPASRAQFMLDYSARVQAMPGIRSAVLVGTGPGSRSFNIGRLEIDGETPPPATSSSFIDVNFVQPRTSPRWESSSSRARRSTTRPTVA